MGNNYNNEKFDSFLNKIIILNSKAYFKKQMSTNNKEKTIINDESYSEYMQSFTSVDDSINFIENNIELNNALNSLSSIEQAVIFLLYKEDLSQSEAAAILEIYSKTVSKIKIRAIEKLKKSLNGGIANEK